VNIRDFVLNATVLYQSSRNTDSVIKLRKKTAGLITLWEGERCIQDMGGGGPEEVESLGIARCRHFIKMYLRAWNGLVWFSIGYLANAVRNILPP
jgi:hypothetical protein